MDDPTYDVRAAAGARAQDRFRNVNEGAADPDDGFSPVLPAGSRICECANDDCTDVVEISAEAYETVRKFSTRFIVSPAVEHVVPDIEIVVDANDRFWIVQKHGMAGELAAIAASRATIRS